MEEMEGGSAMNSNSGGGSFGASGSDITAMGTCFSTGWEQSTYTDIYRHNAQIYVIHNTDIYIYIYRHTTQLYALVQKFKNSRFDALSAFLSTPMQITLQLHVPYSIIYQ